jgi:hypothetical protein
MVVSRCLGRWAASNTPILTPHLNTWILRWAAATRLEQYDWALRLEYAALRERCEGVAASLEQSQTACDRWQAECEKATAECEKGEQTVDYLREEWRACEELLDGSKLTAGALAAQKLQLQEEVQASQQLYLALTLTLTLPGPNPNPSPNPNPNPNPNPSPNPNPDPNPNPNPEGLAAAPLDPSGESRDNRGIPPCGPG